MFQAQDNDRFLVSAGGGKVVVWNLFNSHRRTEHAGNRRKEDRHSEPVTCVAVSRDGSMAVSGKTFISLYTVADEKMANKTCHPHHVIFFACPQAHTYLFIYLLKRTLQIQMYLQCCKSKRHQNKQ